MYVVIFVVKTMVNCPKKIRNMWHTWITHVWQTLLFFFFSITQHKSLENACLWTCVKNNHGINKYIICCRTKRNIPHRRSPNKNEFCKKTVINMKFLSGASAQFHLNKRTLRFSYELDENDWYDLASTADEKLRFSTVNFPLLSNAQDGRRCLQRLNKRPRSVDEFWPATFPPEFAGPTFFRLRSVGRRLVVGESPGGKITATMQQ